LWQGEISSLLAPPAWLEASLFAEEGGGGGNSECLRGEERSGGGREEGRGRGGKGEVLSRVVGALLESVAFMEEEEEAVQVTCSIVCYLRLASLQVW
jgi:hypothetical protein